MKQLFSITAFALLFLIACRPTKQIDWAKECSERFSARTDTFRIITEKVRIDTYALLGIQVPYYVQTVCPPSDTIRIIKNEGSVDCPLTQTIIKTRILHDSIVISRANTAQENLLKSKIDTLNEVIELQKRYNRSLSNNIEVKTRQTHRLAWLSGIGWLIVLIFSASTYTIWKHNH